MKYQIKSPIDGFVKEILSSTTGVKQKGNSPKAQLIYKEIYNDLGKEYWTELKIGGESNYLAVIVPDNLELALKLEETRLEAALLRFELLKERINLESNIDKSETSRADKRYNYNINQAVSQAVSHGRDHENLQKRLKAFGKSTAELDKNIFNQRRKFHIHTSLAEEIKASQKEVDAARLSLRLLEANHALGSISIPFNYEVEQVFVFVGQYINKGDLLAEIKLV